MHGSAPLHGGSVRKSGGVPQDPFQGPAPPGRVHQGEQGWPGAPQGTPGGPPSHFFEPKYPHVDPPAGGGAGGQAGGEGKPGGPWGCGRPQAGKGGCREQGGGPCSQACMHATLHGSLQGCMPPHPPHPPHPKP